MTYAEKLPFYAKSSYLSSKQLAEAYPDGWTADEIAVRQRKMAKAAKSIWRKSF